MIIVFEYNTFVVPQDSGSEKLREIGNQIVNDSGHTKLKYFLDFIYEWDHVPWNSLVCPDS